MRTPFRMLGTGLPNVYLLGGYHQSGEGEDRTVSYEKLSDLYVEIARAIASKHGALTGPELRFLRKRLDMTQAQVGALGGKSEQAAAKWEKGGTPLAESRMVCLAWMLRFAPSDMDAAIKAMTNPDDSLDDAGCYAFRFVRGAWKADPEVAQLIDGDNAMPIVASALTKLREGRPIAFANTGASHRLLIDDQTNENQT